MGTKTVQFQPGMSLTVFLKNYGTEELCQGAVFAMKWPNGFKCRSCGYKGYCKIKSRYIYQCNRCHGQESIKARTTFEGSNLPLTKWFLGMFLLSQSKNGISALEMKRQLGVCYETAWRLKQKLMHVMMERNSSRRLSTQVQVDDAYLGGRRTGKEAQGKRGKTPFIAAVQVDNEGKPERIKLTVVKNFTTKAVENWAKLNLEPGCVVVSDGLRGFGGFTSAGHTHHAKTIGNPKKSENTKYLKWVNIVLGNIKTGLKGTYKAHRPKYYQRYLAEFEYRFNRRYRLEEIFGRLLAVAVLTPPMPDRLLTLAVKGR